jgi:hypothetical protein
MSNFNQSTMNTFATEQGDHPPAYAPPSYQCSTPATTDAPDTFKTSKGTIGVPRERSAWSTYVQQQDKRAKAERALASVGKSTVSRAIKSYAEGFDKVNRFIAAAHGISVPPKSSGGTGPTGTCFTPAHDTALRTMLNSTPAQSNVWFDRTRLESGSSILTTHPDLPELMRVKVSQLHVDGSVAHTAKRVKHNFRCARNATSTSTKSDKDNGLGEGGSDGASRDARTVQEDISSIALAKRDLVKDMKEHCLQIDHFSQELLSALKARSRREQTDSAAARFFMRFAKELEYTIKDSENASESYHSILAQNLQEYYLRDEKQKGLTMRLNEYQSAVGAA